LLHKYDYRRVLPHLQKNERPIFVPFATYKRWRLPCVARDLVLQSCLAEHGAKIDLHAAVVMPDHVHLIFTPLRDEEGWLYSLPDIMRSLKGRAAHNINLVLHRSGPVWQEEFFDHVLRCNESLEEKVEYVCENPRRAGLVKEEEAYPWLWRGRVPII
jgi:REP element-mobilizing transposase RayT